MDTSNARRVAISEEAAWKLLTPKQRMVVKLAAIPTVSGERRTITGLCKGLGTSRVSFYRKLKRAKVKFEAVVVALQNGELLDS